MMVSYVENCSKTKIKWKVHNLIYCTICRVDGTTVFNKLQNMTLQYNIPYTYVHTEYN
jgi:hypothetical protein